MSAGMARARADPEDLTGSLHALGVELGGAPDVTTALTLVAQASLRAVPAAECASLTLLDDSGQLQTTWCSDPKARRISELQYRLRQGPAVEVVAGPAWASVITADLTRDPRWPDLGPSALGNGVRSMLAMSLFASDALGAQETAMGLGAVNLCAPDVDVFTQADQNIALLLAMQGAMALNVAAASERVKQLRVAMATRNTIGQAQGILMERHGLTAAQAFDQLSLTSQSHNRRLRDVAQELTLTGVELA